MTRVALSRTVKIVIGTRVRYFYSSLSTIRCLCVFNSYKRHCEVYKGGKGICGLVADRLIAECGGDHSVGVCGSRLLLGTENQLRQKVNI
jgi:hypothetical protein